MDHDYSHLIAPVDLSHYLDNDLLNPLDIVKIEFFYNFLEVFHTYPTLHSFTFELLDYWIMGNLITRILF